MIVWLDGSIECWGSTCYARELGAAFPHATQLYPSIGGRRLTDEEREWLDENRERLIEAFRAEQRAHDAADAARRQSAAKPQIPMLRDPGEIGVEFAQSRPSRNRSVQSQPATTHPIAPCDPVGDSEFDAIVRTFEQRWLEQGLPIDEGYWRNILMENARAKYRSKRGIR